MTGPHCVLGKALAGRLQEDRESSGDNAGLIGYRCGQGRSRVAGAIAERPGRSDTMRPPDARPPCGE